MIGYMRLLCYILYEVVFVISAFTVTLKEITFEILKSLFFEEF